MMKIINIKFKKQHEPERNFVESQYPGLKVGTDESGRWFVLSKDTDENGYEEFCFIPTSTIKKVEITEKKD